MVLNGLLNIFLICWPGLCCRDHWDLMEPCWWHQGHATHYETLSQLNIDTLSLLILFNLPLKSFSFCKLFVLIILFCLFSFCWCFWFYSHFICQICCTQKNSQNTFWEILETESFFWSAKDSQMKMLKLGWKLKIAVKQSKFRAVNTDIVI